MVQLLDAYKAVNPQMIQVISLNPYKDLTLIDDLVKRAPEVDLLHGGGVVVEYGQGEGARHFVVRNQDIFEPLSREASRSLSDRFESVFNGEDEITSALIRLREGQTSVVAFTVGHGEPATADLNPGGPGIGNWKTRLAKVGCEAIDLNLLADDVPNDLSLLIVPGPRTAFKPEEVAKLRAYVARGGPLIVLLGNSEPSGLEEFLRSFNLEIGKGLIMEPRLNYNRNPFSAFAAISGGPKHTITSPLGANRFVLIPTVAPIRAWASAGRGTFPPSPSTATSCRCRSCTPAPIRGSKPIWRTPAIALIRRSTSVARSRSAWLSSSEQNRRRIPKRRPRTGLGWFCSRAR